MPCFFFFSNIYISPHFYWSILATTTVFFCKNYIFIECYNYPYSPPSLHPILQIQNCNQWLECVCPYRVVKDCEICDLWELDSCHLKPVKVFQHSSIVRPADTTSVLIKGSPCHLTKQVWGWRESGGKYALTRVNGSVNVTISIH